MVDIIWFDGEHATEHGLVGGKGANLGRLTHAGFTVPFGFTLSTEVYRNFIIASGLGDRISAILSGIRYDDPEHLEKSVGEIRALIETTPLPEVLRTDIVTAYKKLGAAYVAVRSSGSAEDLAEASFAGLHDTYLDMRGAEEV